MDIAAMVAEFEAKGGKVEKVEEGKKAIDATDREYFCAMRDGKKLVGREKAAEIEAERSATAMEDAFRAAKYDGWTDAAAHEYAQEAA